jgi:hypothetical protein
MVLKACLLIPSEQIFDSNVEAGNPSFAAAPDGPETRPSSSRIRSGTFFIKCRHDSLLPRPEQSLMPPPDWSIDFEVSNTLYRLNHIVCQSLVTRRLFLPSNNLRVDVPGKDAGTSFRTYGFPS